MEEKKSFSASVPGTDSGGVAKRVDGGLRHNSPSKICQDHDEIYLQALQRYPNDDAIDQADERRLRRKLDARILPLLGVCYFFYVSRRPCLDFLEPPFRTELKLKDMSSMSIRRLSPTLPYLALRRI